MKLSLLALTSILAAGAFASPLANEAPLERRTNLCDSYTKKYGECKNFRGNMSRRPSKAEDVSQQGYVCNSPLEGIYQA